MSERGVTLDKVVRTLSGFCYTPEDDDCKCPYCLRAAKVRAAARVVEAAREQVRHPHNPRSLDALSVALDAFDKEGL